MAAQIKYNGTVIASPEAGQIATLKCADMKMEGDIVVEVPESGGSSGGGAEMNIAYGDTEPTDTSKLWVKTATPEAVRVAPNVTADRDGLAGYIATLPTVLTYHAGASVGKKAYVFGGRNSDNVVLDTINVFDTETNTINTLSTKLPTATMSAAAVSVGAKIYLFGGQSTSKTADRLSTINVFDTETNTTSTLSTRLPTATADITAASVGTKIYLFGSSSSTPKAINVFDTETNTISTISTTLPTASRYMAIAPVGTKIYLFGGRDTDGVVLDTINVFDTEKNTISTLSTRLPTPAYMVAAGAIGTKVYLFGGTKGTSNLDTINVFDTETNTINTLSTKLPTAVNSLAPAAIGFNVYLLGGNGHDGIHKFFVALNLEKGNLLIVASLTKNVFNLLPSVEIGVDKVYKGNEDGNGEIVSAALYKDGAWEDI